MAKKAYVYDGTNWVDLAQSTTDLTNYPNMTTTPISGFRNAIINGSFDIWQRGTSTFTAAGYTADRWRIQNASGQTISLTQQVFTAGNPIPGYEPTNFLRFSLSGTPSGTYWFSQRVEDVRTFAGQTVTLSFWAKASSATTALTPMLEQNFGTGGSTFVQVPGSSISLTTSWQRFTQTFLVPSISGKTVGTSSFIEVRPFYGSTAITGIDIDIWGVQLETGTIATPFEQIPIAVELALCQRYFERFQNTGSLSQNYYTGSGYWTNGVSPYTAIVTVDYKVEKRIEVNPTITGTMQFLTTGAAAVNTSAVTFAGPSKKNVRITMSQTTNAVTAGTPTMGLFPNGVYMDVNAEL